jgi:hypothetical protein
MFAFHKRLKFIAALSAIVALSSCSGDSKPPTGGGGPPQPTTRSVTVTFSGNGGGTVASTSPAGISCAATCTTSVDAASGQVSLTATPNATSTFAGWSGDCSGTTPTCQVVRSGTTAISATAQFTLITHTLTAVLAGTGSGSIASAPAGIACGTDCTEAYTAGTSVTLTATPTASSTFTGWSGGGCTGTGTCTVTMNAAATVTATFALTTRQLTVTNAGTGTGSVASAPAGITCGATCTASFNHGTVVTLTATATASSVFSGWTGGGCTGTGTCVVTLNEATTVTANFVIRTSILTVIKAGAGTGSVSSAPTGITCGADCTETYNYGTNVTLTATPTDETFVFTGWSGACTGTGTCAVTITDATTVTATFGIFQARWPDSPTRICSTSTGFTTCPGGVVGQDGTYALNVPTYQTIGGIVRDEVTGLMWQAVHPPAAMNLSAALTYCDNLTLEGRSDWRVPTFLELVSLVDFGRVLAPFPTVFSGIAQNSYFWSSTGRSGQADQVMGINTNYATSAGMLRTQSEGYYVRCVRGTEMTGTFSVSGGSVTDGRTKLVWQSGVSPTSLDWPNANAYCDALVLDGNSDWRLPSAKELLSLIDNTRVPTFSSLFASQLVSIYWTSSPLPSNARQAYAVDFLSGLSYDIGNPMTNTMSVRCVR